MIKLAPSILSADFGCLRDQVALVERAGADYLHIDVMDGHFVPNITIGPGVVRALRPYSNLFFDVHLMIESPNCYIADFVEAGADLLCVHVETCYHLHRVIQEIKAHGIKAGVALNPATPLVMVEPVLEEVDLVLLMTVNPGFGGQAFIPAVCRKVAELRRWLDDRGLTIDLEVDGGVNQETARLAVQSGANVLVAGSAIFGAPDVAQALRDLRLVAIKD
ncbi:MAG: ribulose-phosphate 3-epimerase [Firmicutes bacterium]|nr:ribulose-phosphate 3-epimerase [Bacillota bacterium]